MARYIKDIIPRARLRPFNPIGPTPELIPAAFREALLWPSAGDQEYLIYLHFGYPDHWVLDQTHTDVFTPEIKALADRMKFYRPLIILVWPVDWNEYLSQTRLSKQAIKMAVDRFQLFKSENRIKLVEFRADEIQRHTIQLLLDKHYRTESSYA